VAGVGNPGMDRDLVLNMWAAGEPVEKIAAAAGVLLTNSVVSLVARARAEGDPRAVKRDTTYGFRGNIAQNMKRVKRMKMLQRFPVTPADLDRAVAAYSGPVTKLKPAVHAGYRPTCLNAIGL